MALAKWAHGGDDDAGRAASPDGRYDAGSAPPRALSPPRAPGAPRGAAAPRARKLTFNFGTMTADEVTYATHVIATSRGVARLRLLHTPSRSAPRAPPRRGVPGPLAAAPGACARLAAALAAHLRGTETLAELELGFCLPARELSLVGAALQRCASLRRLSLAGAPLGDAGLRRLLDGLQACPWLEHLKLSGCGLSDASGQALATLIREHAHQRAYCDWRSTLRVYPMDAAMVAPARPRTSVPPPCPVLGLIHLDISDNGAMGLTTARALAAAIEPARHATRLRTLDARRCGMPATAGDYLADAMRRGAALQSADLRHNTPAGSALGCVVRSEDGRGVEHLTLPPEDAEAAAERARKRAAAAPVEQPPMYVGPAPPARAGPPRVHVPPEARAAADAARRAAASRAAAARRAAAAAAAAASPLAGRRPRTAPAARGSALQVEALTRQLTSALGALEAAVAGTAAAGHSARPPRARSFGRQHSGLTPRSDAPGEPADRNTWAPWASPDAFAGGGDDDEFADDVASDAASGPAPRRGLEAMAYASGFEGGDGGANYEDGGDDNYGDDDFGGEADAAEGEDSWDDLFPPPHRGGGGGGAARGSPAAAGAAAAATDALFRSRGARLGLTPPEEAAVAALLAAARLERDSWRDGDAGAGGPDWPGSAADDAGDDDDDDAAADDVDSLFRRAAAADADTASADADTPRRPARAAPAAPRGSEDLVAAVAAQLSELCDLRDR